MTPLRQQLLEARQQHRSSAYPGDLATDIFAELDRQRRQRVMRIVWGGAIAAVASLAACVIIGLLLLRSPTPLNRGDEDLALAAIPDAPGRPDMPEGILAVPHESIDPTPAITAAPAMPEMPGWGLAMSDEDVKG